MQSIYWRGYKQMQLTKKVKKFLTLNFVIVTAKKY